MQLKKHIFPTFYIFGCRVYESHFMRYKNRHKAKFLRGCNSSMAIPRKANKYLVYTTQTRLDCTGHRSTCHLVMNPAMPWYRCTYYLSGLLMIKMMIILPNTSSLPLTHTQTTLDNHTHLDAPSLPALQPFTLRPSHSNILFTHSFTTVLDNPNTYTHP